MSVSNLDKLKKPNKTEVFLVLIEKNLIGPIRLRIFCNTVSRNIFAFPLPKSRREREKGKTQPKGASYRHPWDYQTVFDTLLKL